MSKLGSSCSRGRRSAGAPRMPRMLMTSCLMCGAQTKGRSEQAEQVHVDGREGLEKSGKKGVKHICVDQRDAEAESRREPLRQGEWRGGEKRGTESPAEWRAVIYRGGEPQERVCNAKRGSGKSERSKTERMRKKCKVKSSGYRQRERKECWSEPFVFGIKPRSRPFSQTQRCPVKCINVRAAMRDCYYQASPFHTNSYLVPTA